MRDLYFSHVTTSGPIRVAASGPLVSIAQFAIRYYVFPSVYLFVYIPEPVSVCTHVQSGIVQFTIRYSTLPSVSLPTNSFSFIRFRCRMAGPPYHGGAGAKCWWNRHPFICMTIRFYAFVDIRNQFQSVHMYRTVAYSSPSVFMCLTCRETDGDFTNTSLPHHRGKGVQPSWIWNKLKKLNILTYLTIRFSASSSVSLSNIPCHPFYPIPSVSMPIILQYWTARGYPSQYDIWLVRPMRDLYFSHVTTSGPIRVAAAGPL